MVVNREKTVEETKNCLNELAEKKMLKVEEFKKYQVSRFGSRYTEYRKNWEQLTDLENLPTFPYYINVESIFACNLACPSCLFGEYTVDLLEKYSLPYKGEKKMSIESFDMILEQAKEAEMPSIGLNWYGEPLLLDDIDLRIKKCADAGIMDIIMSTNGQLLTPDISEKIIDAGITHVLFSVDAASADIYSLTRPRGDFNRLINNIKAFNEIRKKKTGGIYPVTRASFIPTALNQHQIADFEDFFSGLVDFVEFQTFQKFYDRTDALIPKDSSVVSFKCDDVFKKLTIKANGDIHSCCSIHVKGLPLGNIKKDKIKDVFQNNPVLQQVREDVINGSYTLEHCVMCQKSFYKVSK